MKTSKHVLALAAVVVAGLSVAVTSAIAQGPDELVGICYRGRTIQVPAYLVPRYIAKGADPVPCLPTP